MADCCGSFEYSSINNTNDGSLFKMVTVTISKKLAKEYGVSLGKDEGENTDFYIHTIDIMNEILIIIVKPKSYYSYTAIAKNRSANELDSILKEKIGTSDLCYMIEGNVGELARVSTIGKKYTQLINMMLENTDNAIVLEEIESLANLTPWKFLGFKSPNELEATPAHSKTH